VLGRLVIDNVRPRTPTGEWPAKAVVGESVTVSADIFKDGHDILAAQVRWQPFGGDKWESVPMTAVINDRWEALIEPTELGRHEIVVKAWTSHFATWVHKVETNRAVGQDLDVEIMEGKALLERRMKRVKGDEEARLKEAIGALDDAGRELDQRLAPALSDVIATIMAGPDDADDLTTAPPNGLWVDRERALVGAWYELFPRSEGGFRGVAEKRLPAVAKMGFDVLYMPPIHPIGRSFRKGRNNTLEPAADDPGSPWAIGAKEGGHLDIDAGLGSLDDFRALVQAAHDHHMEIALDYALQCSPDHPWVSEHPEWFHHRPDGSIAYAENPPKKYQDIYPINFWPAKESDREALWDACKEILDHWIAQGVRIFRVDNPHTKPMAFWAWLIEAVQAQHADVLFLAEAFTRPKVMAKLAEVGFSQSYTYFTWRTDQWGEEGLRAYLEELAGEKADYMRPNFWPNTPDILSGPLRNGPPPAFRMRFLLAATLTPSYGVYSGYELYENEPASPANEEYLYSEKYEVKRRDWSRPEETLVPYITRVNDIRRRHPALQRLRNIRFHGSVNDRVIAYSKVSDDGSDVVLMVVNLDPYVAQETTLALDLDELGMPADRPFEAYDEITGAAYTWWGPNPYVRLDPWVEPAHVLHLRAVSGR
jgi:starch synthase (maltosyl-transferring)